MIRPIAREMLDLDAAQIDTDGRRPIVETGVVNDRFRRYQKTMQAEGRLGVCVLRSTGVVQIATPVRSE